MKALLIGLVIIIAGLATWRIIAGRVDRTKPDAVAHAFLVALKNKDISTAGKYFEPATSEAWQTAAKAKMDAMQSGSFERFFGDLPDGSAAFVAVPRTPPAPANEMTMSSAGTILDLKQIDRKWYVCKGPL